MTFERKTDMLLTNSNGKFAEVSREEPTKSWLKMNERTFSLSLFIFSLSIVLAKLYTNYGRFLQISDQYTLPSVKAFAQIYDVINMPNISISPTFDMKQLPAHSEKFLNASNQYAEAAANVLVTFYEKYRWLLKAILSGLITTGFTWFIIYNDSSVPGVNPPSPFSPSKHRVSKGPRIQMNYLVGVINGMIFFIYMCL